MRAIEAQCTVGSVGMRINCGRQVAHKHMRTKRAAKLLAQMKDWARCPQLNPEVAAMAAEKAVHRLLTLRLADVLEHPSWMIGAGGVLKKPTPVNKAADWTHLLGVRPKKCERMHDLRKAVREVRYVIENVDSIYAGKDHARLLKARDMLVQRQKVGQSATLTTTLLPELVPKP